MTPTPTSSMRRSMTRCGTRRRPTQRRPTPSPYGRVPATRRIHSDSNRPHRSRRRRTARIAAHPRPLPRSSNRPSPRLLKCAWHLCLALAPPHSSPLRPSNTYPSKQYRPRTTSRPKSRAPSASLTARVSSSAKTPRCAPSLRRRYRSPTRSIGSPWSRRPPLPTTTPPMMPTSLATMLHPRLGLPVPPRRVLLRARRPPCPRRPR